MLKGLIVIQEYVWSSNKDTFLGLITTVILM